jgi:hypothetical protein
MATIDIRLLVESAIWGSEDNIPLIIKRRLLCNDTKEDLPLSEQQEQLDYPPLSGYITDTRLTDI